MYFVSCQIRILIVLFQTIRPISRSQEVQVKRLGASLCCDVTWEWEVQAPILCHRRLLPVRSHYLMGVPVAVPILPILVLWKGTLRRRAPSRLPPCQLRRALDGLPGPSLRVPDLVLRLKRKCWCWVCPGLVMLLRGISIRHPRPIAHHRISSRLTTMLEMHLQAGGTPSALISYGKPVPLWWERLALCLRAILGRRLRVTDCRGSCCLLVSFCNCIVSR